MSSKRSSQAKSSSKTSAKKSKQDVHTREKYALVFYLADKSTGVVLASDIRPNVKVGSQVLVPDPYDWTGPKSMNKFQAKLIKFGYDPEFLYNSVLLNKEGVEIKGQDENQERAARKQQEKIKAAQQRSETLKLNQKVNSRPSLFSAVAQQLASVNASTQDLSNSIVQESSDAGYSEESNVNTAEDSVAVAEPHPSPPPPIYSCAPESGPSNVYVYNNNYVDFITSAEEAKLTRRPLPTQVLPKLECLIPSPNKVELGESKLYISKQKAMNMPWVVYQPPDKMKCRVPEDNPTAVYPRAFVNYLLDCLIPKEILRHLRGPTMPKIIFEGIRDYVNARLDRKHKLLDKHIKLFISDYARTSCWVNLV